MHRPRWEAKVFARRSGLPVGQWIRIFNVYPYPGPDMRTRISKWGNSLGVRIPKAFAAEVALDDGTPVDISVSAGRIVISPLRREYELEELVEGITDENRHTETDWGEPAGAEVW